MTTQPTTPYTSPWREVQAEYACEHELTEIRRRRDSLDRPHAVRQCLRCGANRGGVSRATVPQFDTLPAYDETKQAAYESEMRNEVERRALAGSGERKQSYLDYLLTPRWRALRSLVLARDNHLCQCCLTATATEVHHTTYAHRGAERAWELQSCCHDCHLRITEDDQGAAL